MDQPVRPNRFLDRTLLPVTGFPLKLQEHKRLPATFKGSLADILRWHNLPSAPGSSPGLGHCVVFLSKTLYSHGASLHPGV